MAAERVRRWGVPPDTSIITQQHGEIPCVSRQAMIEAIMDGEAMLARSGGILEVVVQRHPTDLAGEAVTTGAVVSWKAGVSATLEQPRPAPAPAPEPPPVAAGPDLAAEMQQQLATVARPAPAPQITGTAPGGAVAVQEPPPVAAPRDDIGDGLDHPDADIDLSEIPADHR